MALPAVRLHPTHRILPQPSKCLEGLGVPRSSLPLKMVWVPNPDRHFPHAVAVVDGDLGLAVLQHDVASILCHRNRVAHLGDLANAQQQLCLVNHCKVAFQDLAVLKSHGNCLRSKVRQNSSIGHGKLLVPLRWCHNSEWQSGAART